MELVSFRIRNYRSIQDTGECYFSPDITVLAGQNEAGKTSILEALEDFNRKNKIREEAKPVDREKSPEIIVKIRCTSDEMMRFMPSIFEQNINQDVELVICKDAQGRYEIANSAEYFEDILEARQERKKFVHERLEEIKNETRIGDKLNQDISEDLVDTIGFFMDQIESLRESSETFGLKNGYDYDSFISKLEKLRTKILPFERFEEMLLYGILKELPEFVFFDSKENIIPNEVSISDIEENEFVQDLSQISDLDIETIISTDSLEKKKHQKKVNMQLNQDYQQFWTQDNSRLHIDWGYRNLSFFILEDEVPYRPTMRSSGRIWHLSFYTRMTAHSKRDKPPIILIDDPGLHLHARAQRDILDKLEDVSKITRVMYTTHSPYLIDPDHLDRVWLVEKDDNEGTVIKKLHAGAEKYTLTPVITALGANTDLGVFPKQNIPIVVEGISDYYYLKSIFTISDFENEKTFIVPGTGGESPVHIGSIFFGWGKKPVFVLDADDNRTNKNARKLKKKLKTPEDRILYIGQPDGCIEDIFSIGFFEQEIAEEDVKQSNSDYAGSNDKVLLAKQFYEKVKKDKISLDEETKKNIDKFIASLKSALDNR